MSKSSLAQKAAILATLQAPQNVERCDDCSGWVEPGKFSYIRLPLKDEAGSPVYDKDGNPRHTQIALKHHVLLRTPLDPTGLIPVACNHGVKTHPSAEVQSSQAGRMATTWVRAKYVQIGGQFGTSCPVCRGEPAPEDMTGAVPA